MTTRLARSTPLFALATGLALAAGPGAAQDDGLYPMPSAPDASFLRVFVPGDETVAVDGHTLQPGESGLTPYVEVAPGPVVISVNGEEATVDAGPNAHYSYIVADGEPLLLTDTISGSPTQADLVFYNLSDLQSTEVYVPEADAVAIADVTSGASGEVALRAPLTLDFEVRSDGKPVAQVEGVELVRSAATTVLLKGGPGGYEAHAEINSYTD